MITSPSNDKVKRIVELQKKAKARKKEGVFVSEGLRMVMETPVEFLQELYISEAFLASPEKMQELKAFDSSIIMEVTDEVMKKMADTDHPQGILAVSKIPSYSVEEVVAGDCPMLLVTEDVQDPGNLGTMFRTAEGAGATGLILSAGTADPMQPKVVRSTMGSIFRMPFIRLKDDAEWAKMMDVLREKKITTYAAWLDGSVPYDEPDYKTGTAFLIGNEGNGLKASTAEHADARIRIPMGGKLESLNAAMSAGILMYEAARQRK